MNGLTFFSPSFADSVLEALDKGFRDNFGLSEPAKYAKCNLPSVDVLETEKAYVMEIDLPGYTEEDVSISLKDRALSISSSKNDSKKEEKHENGTGYIIRERRSSSFARRFTLPDDIDQEAVSARFENGVLKIDIPRKPDTQPRQIAITKQ